MRRAGLTLLTVAFGVLIPSATGRESGLFGQQAGVRRLEVTGFRTWVR
jgi:hypothetical protein